MNGDFICTAAFPVNGNALILEEIRQPSFYRSAVSDDIALVGSNECSDLRPRYDDFALTGLEP
jgi:hypothetical protein